MSVRLRDYDQIKDGSMALNSLELYKNIRIRWTALRRDKPPETKPTTKVAPPRTGGPPAGRPRPQPIAGTPPPEMSDKCDSKIIQQTCNLFGLDLERPPPVPPSRSYTVTGNTKLGIVSRTSIFIIDSQIID